jgi:hypothetical protein
MRRRDFIVSIGGATAVLLPLAVRGQQRPLPMIGYLSSGSIRRTHRILFKTAYPGQGGL